MISSKNQKAGKFSTGMKQRAALAMTLLSDPDIMILDEPTNGLDPEGIIEIRELLQSLRNQGKTILVSSHLLSEMEKIADKVLILKEGNLIFSGPIYEMGVYRDLESFYMSNV